MKMISPSLCRSRRRLLACLAAAACPSAWARLAALPELADGLPGARLQGAGRLDFLGLHVYDIRLWVGEGFSAAEFARSPLALEIEYARALSGGRIAERALEEMQRIAPIADAQRLRWLGAMTQAFPDVSPGERLTGVFWPDEGVRFFHNGRLRADIADAEFARNFFAIWLSPKSSQPKLRLALLGSAA